VPRSGSSSGVTRVEFDSRLPYRAVLLALALLGAGLLFEQLVDLLLLVMMAVILALPLAASATWLEHLRVPRVLGAMSALAAAGALLAVVVIFVVPRFVAQVNAFISELPATGRHFERVLNHTFGLRPGNHPAGGQAFRRPLCAAPVDPARAPVVGRSDSGGGLWARLW
jgi:predicted PurR-regulated permease PerM